MQNCLQEHPLNLGSKYIYIAFHIPFILHILFTTQTAQCDSTRNTPRSVYFKTERKLYIQCVKMHCTFGNPVGTYINFSDLDV